MPIVRDQIRPYDPILADLMLDYRQDSGTMIGSRIFPARSAKETGWYYVFEANQKFRRYKAKRADGSEARAIKIRMTKDSFFQDAYGLKMAVTDRERDNEMGALNLDQEAGFHVKEALDLDFEMRCRDIVLPTSYSPDGAATPLWTAANAQVLLNNEQWKADFKKKSGKRPNKAIVSQAIWQTWQDPTVVGSMGWLMHEKLKYTSDRMGSPITPAMVAQMLGLDEILIGDTIFTDTPLTSSIPGTAGITAGQFIWNTRADNSTAVNELVYLYVSPNSGIKTMTYGACFQARSQSWKRYREEKLEKDWIEGSQIEVLKVIAPACISRYTVM